MAGFRVDDRVPEALDESWSVEDLLGQRAQRAVVAVEEREAAAGVARRNAGEEVEVVVDDRRCQRAAGHVDDVCSRQPEQHQQAEEPFFVVLHSLDLLQFRGVEAEAGDHDDGTRGVGVGEDPGVHRGERGLQAGEGFQFDARPRLGCRGVGCKKPRSVAGTGSRPVLCRSRHETAIERAGGKLVS